MSRKTFLLSVTALAVLLPAPAYAHPFTGGPSTPAQVAISVAGALAAFAGLVIMLRTRPRESTSGTVASIKTRRTGMLMCAVGLVAFIVGPDIVAPKAPACVRPTTQASLDITTPTDGQTYPDGKVDVTVNLTGGKIAGLESTKNVDGEGHLHLSVDGRLQSMSGAPEQQLELPTGQHKLDVEYVANDHAPFCSRVIASRNFTVEG